MNDSRISCPWPGLVAYDEADRDQFLGRDAEADALLRLVRRSTLTVLYGQSGLGKTSLLQAGLFPRLRGRDAFPVRVRLSFDPLAGGLTQQVLRAIGEAASSAVRCYPKDAALHVAPPQIPGESEPIPTLWEYFHRRGNHFWTGLNRIATPVIVFDQFEEWFTRGGEVASEEREAFLSDLLGVLDNRLPKHIEERTSWEVEGVPFAMVIALREDFLAHLYGLERYLPGVRNNGMRLLPFSEEQARVIIANPSAPWPPEEGFTNTVLAALRAAERRLEGRASIVSARDSEYDPAILSLVLNRLFDDLVEEADCAARSRLVQERGAAVLRDFYEDALIRAQAGVRDRKFIEEHLITASGLRNTFALEDAISERHGASEKVLRSLQDAFLLHFDHRALGHERVELAHDVLCNIVMQVRDERRAHEAALAASDLRKKEITVDELIIGDHPEDLQGTSDEVSLRASGHLVEGADLLERGMIGGAEKALRRGRRAFAWLLEGETTNDKYLRGYGHSQLWVGDIQWARGDLGGAQQAFEKFRDISTQLSRKDLNNADRQRDLAIVHNRLGRVMEARGDLGGAQRSFEKYREISEQLAAKNPDRGDLQREVAVGYCCLGGVMLARGDLGGAQRAFEKYREISAHLVGMNPGNADWQRDLAVSHTCLGAVMEARGDFVRSQRVFEQARVIMEQLAESNPDQVDWQRELAVCHNSLGRVMEAQGDLAGAQRAFDEDLEISERLTAKEPDNAEWQRDLATTYSRRGGVMEARGYLASAQREFAKCKEILAKLAVQGPDNVDWQLDLASALRHVGECSTGLQQPQAAIETLIQAREVSLRLLSGSDGLVVHRWQLVRIRSSLALAMSLVERFEEALTELELAESDAAVIAAGSGIGVTLQCGPALVDWRTAEVLLKRSPSARDIALLRLEAARNCLQSVAATSGLPREQAEWFKSIQALYESLSPGVVP